MKEYPPTLHPQSENGEDKIENTQKETLPESPLGTDDVLNEIRDLETNLETQASEEALGLIERGKQKLITRIEELGFGNNEIETGQKLLSVVQDKIGELTARFKRNIKRFSTIATFATVILYQVSEHPVPKDETLDEMLRRAKTELANEGITSEQRQGYTIGLNEILYRGITPLSYQDEIDEDEFLGSVLKHLEGIVPNIGAIQDFIPNVIHGREREHENPNGKSLKLSEKPIPALEDAWRLYLGMSQQNDTFSISDYQPSKRTEESYYYTIKDFKEKFQAHLEREARIFDTEMEKAWIEIVDGFRAESNGDAQALDSLIRDWSFSDAEYEMMRDFEKTGDMPPKDIKGYVEWLQKQGGRAVVETEVRSGERGESSDVMFHYTMSLGEDEEGSYISYYDKWDLDVPFEDEGGFFGQPFEIYDRIYYDPETFEMLDLGDEDTVIAEVREGN